MALIHQPQAWMKARHGQRIGTMPVQLQHHPTLPPLRTRLTTLRKTARPTTFHTPKPTASGHHTSPTWQASGRLCLRGLGDRLACATRPLILVGPALRRKQVPTRIRVAGHKGGLTLPSLMVTLTRAAKSLNQMHSRPATSMVPLRRRRTRDRLLPLGRRVGSALLIRTGRGTARRGTSPTASRAGVKRVST
jgi:hypothetical protein